MAEKERPHLPPCMSLTVPYIKHTRTWSGQIWVIIFLKIIILESNFLAAKFLDDEGP
jgi:hypothetical protein